MTIRQQVKVAERTQMREESGELHVQGQIAQVPGRPDRTVLNDSIPLFFIGRDRNGFWVARESEKRSGGSFIFKRSATRFALKQSAPQGCATMFVEHTVELDVSNQGNQVVESIATAIGFVRRRAPFVTNLIELAIAQWRKLDAQISSALTDHRRNREAIENDLFRGEYKLVSKNNDDLPFPR